MFSVRRNFGFIGKIFGVPRAVLSRICSFCSSWTVAGNIISLTIPEFPDPEKNPIVLSVNEDAMMDLIGNTVKSVNGESPDEDGNVTVDVGAKSVNGESPDEDGNVTVDVGAKSVNGESPDEDGNVTVDVGVRSVNGVGPDSSGNVAIEIQETVGALTEDDIGVEGGVQGYSSRLESLSSNLDQDGKVPITSITGNISGHSGNCLVTIGDGGNLGHSGNVAYDAVTELSEDYDEAGKKIPYAKLSSDLLPNKWMKTDASGKISTSDETPIFVPEDSTPYDGELTVVTDVVWDGNDLKKKSRKLNFSSGVLTSVGNETSGTVDTPTKITWS